MLIELRASEGYISIPDGASIYIWGYTPIPGQGRLPGPNIVVNQGETVRVELLNEISEPTSLMFWGQGPVMDVTGGVPIPVSPVYEQGRLVSLVNHVRPQETIIYEFLAQRPGTFLYHSGTNITKQVQMGLYGCLIVRPAGFDPHNPATWTAYGSDTGTEFDREYLLITSEIDPVLHEDVRKGKPFAARAFRPRYWTLNGRCAHDTMVPHGVGYLPQQPYSAMIMAEPDEKVLLRYAGAGSDNHPLHPHGNHTRVVAMDGNLLKNGTYDLSRKRFTVLVGCGQTVDQVFQWHGLGYDPDAKPLPTPLPGLRNQVVGAAGWTMWSGDPYLGRKGDIPVGITSFNMLGEYNFMLHSHEELQITNWAEFPGGMMTMISIMPPGTLPKDENSLVSS